MTIPEPERRDPQTSTRPGFTRYDWGETLNFGDGIFISDSFSSAEITVIERSLETMFSRVFDNRTADCVVEYTSDSTDSIERERWNNFVQIISSGGRGGNGGWRKKHLYIDRFYENSDTRGEALAGIAVDDGDFSIRLNAYHLREAANSPSSSRGRIKIQRYAGVIVHEMLHNLGFVHTRDVEITEIPETDIITTNVAGNYTYESGWCVARNSSSKTHGEYGLVGHSENERNIPESAPFFIDGNLINRAALEESIRRAELRLETENGSGFTICNQSSEPKIYVAIGHYDVEYKRSTIRGARDIVGGWFHIEQGQCRQVIKNSYFADLPENSDIYFYATSNTIDPPAQWQIENLDFLGTRDISIARICVDPMYRFSWDPNEATCSQNDRRTFAIINRNSRSGLKLTLN